MTCHMFCSLWNHFLTLCNNLNLNATMPHFQCYHWYWDDVPTNTCFGQWRWRCTVVRLCVFLNVLCSYSAMLCLTVSLCTVTVITVSVVGLMLWLLWGEVRGWVNSVQLTDSRGNHAGSNPLFFGPAGLLTIYRDINRKNYTLHPCACRRREKHKERRNEMQRQSHGWIRSIAKINQQLKMRERLGGDEFGVNSGAVAF